MPRDKVARTQVKILPGLGDTEYGVGERLMPYNTAIAAIIKSDADKLRGSRISYMGCEIDASWPAEVLLDLAIVSAARWSSEVLGSKFSLDTELE
jgi:hypothetical protein